MTKKDFIQLANALRDNVPAPDSNPNTREAESVLFENIVNSVMDVCHRANPRFDRAKFAAACGLEEVKNGRALSAAA